MSKGEQTRQLIVDKALMLAQRIGLEQVSLGMLADELDLSKSGLFAHFKAKEHLQLEVVNHAIELFTQAVILPALREPRGLPRMQRLFDGYIEWVRGRPSQTGCVLMALSYEYDDRPGPVRDALVRSQLDWLDSIGRVAKTAIEEKQFHPELDVKQFAFELDGLIMAFHQSFKVRGNQRAEAMARKAFKHLLERAAREPF